MKKWLMWVVILALCTVPRIGFSSGKQEQPAVVLPVEKVVTEQIQQGKRLHRTVSFPNTDTYWMERIEFSHNQPSAYIRTLTIPGQSGTVRYVKHNRLDGKTLSRTWETAPLGDSLPTTYVFIDTDQMHLLLSFPEVYRKGMRNTLEEKPNPLPVRVKKVKNGYELAIAFPQSKGTVGEVWALQSSEPLVDWSNATLERVWSLLDVHDEQKWSWDGFYVKTPSTYEPYSPKLYWRLPANYVAESFINTGGSRAAADLGWVMLNTILPNQNQYGFWETQPASKWLKDLYGLQAGFYDTRFNTDMGLLLLKGYRKYHDPRFLEASQRYAQFLLGHISKNHFVVKGEQEGWLVEDYAHPTQKHRRTHSSLNHQLQEIKFLLEMYAETKQSSFHDHAMKLLFGVKNTTAKWKKADNDLHYAYLPNGRMGLADYPFLTYNDLWQTQRLLVRLYGQSDQDLTALMESKKMYMDARSITGYIALPLP
ncbi:MAG: hypothetical protein ACM32O_17725 [Clostridia bacterium]